MTPAVSMVLKTSMCIVGQCGIMPCGFGNSSHQKDLGLLCCCGYCQRCGWMNFVDWTPHLGQPVGFGYDPRHSGMSVSLISLLDKRALDG